jgi:Transposase DDE domain group 1
MLFRNLLLLAINRSPRGNRLLTGNARASGSMPRALRPAAGNVQSADGWRSVQEPVIARYRGTVKRLYFRGDAAFANPEMCEFLEAEGIGYTIRLGSRKA